MQIQTSNRGLKAFTLRELLVCLCMVFLLAWVTAPASGKSRAVSHAVLCLANMRLLSHAFQLYAQDNDGRFVPNLHGAAALGFGGERGWASGWLDWSTTPDNTNTMFLRDSRYAKLAPYIAANRNIHKCPADTFLSPLQKARRWQSRVRSAVMNATVGPGNAMAGPWDASLVQVQSYADLGRTRNAPAHILTFMEEHPDSINDSLIFPPRTSGWIDLPASLHNGASTAAFLDGRAELHSWRATGRSPQVRFNFRPLTPRPGDPDVAWFRANSAMRR